MNPELLQPSDPNAGMARRMMLAAGMIVLGFGTVGWRLYDLQILRHEDVTKKVTKMHKVTKTILAARGAIRDTNGELLAHDRPVYDLWVDTQKLRHLSDVKTRLTRLEKLGGEAVVKSWTEKEFTDRYADHVATVLSKLMHPGGEMIEEKQGELLAVLTDVKKVDVPLKKGLTEEQMNEWKQSLAEAQVLGTDFRPSMSRHYPCGERLTHVLGFVDYRHDGKEGVEAVMNTAMQGTNGTLETERDRKGREIAARRSLSVDAVNGNEVWLTIDMHLQELLESVLEEKAELYQPKKIVGVIVDPKTGAILAMASRPLLEHRDREGDLSEVHGKRKSTSVDLNAIMTTASPAIAQQYEPGSVFKIVTFAGVFDRKLADMGELINCDPEQKTVAHLGLHDHVSGKITVCQVLSRSSNVGTYLLARRLGEDSFMDYLDKFGFGKKTGISLTGEIRGDVMARKHWDALTFSRMCIGHSISVTPLQMAMATAAIANHGMLMKPQIIREVRDSKGHLVEARNPEEAGRICSPEAAAFVTKAMENVMLDEHGTGHNKVIVPGVRVAGKTGTSQRRKDKGVGYDKGHYAVSFAGFAPVENPQLALLVVVDDPKAPTEELTGGTLAGPIFAQIMGHSLEHLAMVAGLQGSKGEKE